MTGERIMIIGGPGSGKTWLARELSKLLHLPIYCVDDAVHNQSGQLRADADIDQTIRAWAVRNSWIIEGGNSRTYADRVARASILILLDPPRWIRVFRVAMRDKFRRPILYWSLKYDDTFRTRNRAVLKAAGPNVKVYLIRNRSDVSSLLKSIQCS